MKTNNSELPFKCRKCLDDIETEGVMLLTEVAQAVADRVERAGATMNFVYVYQPGHHFAYNSSQGMFFILGTLGWMTVLLGGFLVVNTIAALMDQQVRQIGIMKATGAQTLQILGMYVVLMLAFGLMALLIAVPLANWAAKTIGDGMAAWLNFLPATYGGYSSTLIQQAVVALVVPVLVAMFPLYNSVRITVREALSDWGRAAASIRSWTCASTASWPTRSGTVTGVLDFAQHRPGAEDWGAMRSYLDANPRGKHGAIVYDLADFGLDARELERRFGAYGERFSLPSDV